MKLYVMRHGPAEDDAPTGRDADRALTAAGRERVAAVAKALSEANESPFAILSSPLVRAMQTAEIVADITHLARRAREDKKAQIGGVNAQRREGLGHGWPPVSGAVTLDLFQFTCKLDRMTES